MLMVGGNGLETCHCSSDSWTATQLLEEGIFAAAGCLTSCGDGLVSGGTCQHLQAQMCSLIKTHYTMSKASEINAGGSTLQRQRRQWLTSMRRLLCSHPSYLPGETSFIVGVATEDSVPASLISVERAACARGITTQYDRSMKEREGLVKRRRRLLRHFDRS